MKNENEPSSNKLNSQSNNWYLIPIIGIALFALTLDYLFSTVGVNLEAKNLIDTSGKTLASLQISYPWWYQILGFFIKFLYGLSAAIFITVFVASRLQKTQQDEKKEELKKLHEAININVFDSLFKTIIPEEIFKIIKQEIIENKVLRKNARWIYDFSEKDGKIFARMTTVYEIHNLSQDAVSNPIKLELNNLGGEEYNIEFAECLSNVGDQLVKYDPSDRENNKNIEVKTTDTETSIAYSVEVPPESYVEYKTVFTKFYPIEVVDSQVTKIPVVGAEIIVNFPEKYTFQLIPTMSTKPRLITESNIQKIFRVEGGILPWQGFTFSLVKIKPS